MQSFKLLTDEISTVLKTLKTERSEDIKEIKTIYK